MLFMVLHLTFGIINGIKMFKLAKLLVTPEEHQKIMTLFTKDENGNVISAEPRKDTNAALGFVSGLASGGLLGGAAAVEINKKNAKAEIAKELEKTVEHVKPSKRSVTGLALAGAALGGLALSGAGALVDKYQHYNDIHDPVRNRLLYAMAYQKLKEKEKQQNG